MKKLTQVSKVRQLASDTQGATMVEYALMLFLILAVAGGIVKTLGSTTKSAITDGNAQFQ